jgi:hypothetical protein
MIAAIRYMDTFAKIDGAWLFEERRLYVDWIEERSVRIGVCDASAIALKPRGDRAMAR